MNRLRTYALIAGLGLITLSNAAVLLGVAYNRSGEPESELRLTQRELQVPYRPDASRENSGLSLTLRWRVWAEPQPGFEYRAGRYAAMSGIREAPWLNRPKLKALGFNLSDSGNNGARNGLLRFSSQPPREVLLVLELNGPTYQRSLALAKEYVAREEAKLAADPGNKTLNRQVTSAREALEWEATHNSRLFVVDAGMSRTALRAQYPDRTHYAIVRGRVEPLIIQENSERKVTGIIDGLDIDHINVPLAFRDVFDRERRATDLAQRNATAFQATIAFGKRLEPWIVDATRQ